MTYAAYPSMKISSPVTCERLLRPKLNFNQEELWCVALSNECEYLGYLQLGEGNMSSVPLYLRKVLAYSFQLQADQIILLHSHIGPHSFPSDNDLFWTEKIKKIFDLLDLKLSDHIIISQKTFTSLLQYDPQLFDE